MTLYWRMSMNPTRKVIIGGIAALLLGACSAASPPEPTNADIFTTIPDEATSVAGNPVAPSATAALAEATSESASIPGRPDAPAPVEADFRADPASVVAATGKPQLLEFFAYW
jgi:hypothetical protein